MAELLGKNLRVYRDDVLVACAQSIGKSINNNSDAQASTCSEGVEVPYQTTQTNELTIDGLWTYDTAIVGADDLLDTANAATDHVWKVTEVDNMGVLVSGAPTYEITGFISSYTDTGEQSSVATYSVTILGKTKFTKTINP